MGATKILCREGESSNGGDCQDRLEAVGRIELFDTRREPRILTDAPQEAERLTHPVVPGSITRHASYRSVLTGMSGR
jgi:hypothetical protein